MKRSIILRFIISSVLLTALVVVQADKVNKTTVSKEVDFAPEADLINGNDDVDVQGNCKNEIEESCNDVTPGEGRIGDCLSDLITESEVPSSDEPVSVSDPCREEVYQFKILRNSNINKNIPLARACKVDAEKYCNVTWFFGYKSGQVIACLRDVKEQLSPGCKKQVTKIQFDAAMDYRADALLHEACTEDAGKLCPDVKSGGGRVQACLREKRMQLSWMCEEQLFRQEMENADDIRLSGRLFVNCLSDKRKFCEDVEPGNAKVKDCLEEHRNEDGFSESCQEEVNAMIERRVRDFRLDSRLRKTCETDIYSMCAFDGDLDSMDVDDSSVIRCLQDYVGQMKSVGCKQLVLTYQKLASEDIRFDVPLADACFDDRQKYCADVPPGSARVIRCLETNRGKLSKNCRAVMFDEEVRFSDNIDFQFPMKTACSKETQLFCKDVPHGQGRVIRCLQDNMKSKDFGKKCKEAIVEYDQESAQDYRLNGRLATYCKADIDSLCLNSCNAEEGQLCGGTVLRCLTENKEDIKSSECQKEVFYFEKMEVTDFRNDVILAAACRADVDKFCSRVDPGEGRVHDCLRQHRKELSDTCRKEELLLEEQEAENIELRPGLLRTCQDERNMFCKGVPAGSARVFRCLAEKMGDSDFGEACRGQIMSKLQRRQTNWKLDPSLRRSCKSDVQEFCAPEAAEDAENGSVYKCLIRNLDAIDEGCLKEVGRAVHMAFFAWQPQGVLTAECDDDVKRLCLSVRPNMAKTPGAVGSCLASILEKEALSPQRRMLPEEIPPATRGLSPQCHLLADVAEPPNAREAFESSLTVALLQSHLSALESATGLQMMSRNRLGEARAVTLTGWTAILGIGAMVVVLIWGVAYGYRRYKGLSDRDYTVVLKGGSKR